MARKRDIKSIGALVAKRRKAEEKAKERAAKATMRAIRAEQRRQKAESRLRKEFRKRTGLSVREVQRSSWWMNHVEREAEVELMKADISLWIREATTVEELARILNRANYMVRKHKQLAVLCEHTEELEALYEAGLLERWQIEAVMKYGRRGEAN